MKIHLCFVLASVLLSHVLTAEGARILFLGAIGAMSHKNSFMPLIKELGQRNHTVIFLTHTESKSKSKGVTEVVIHELLPTLYKNMPKDLTGKAFGDGGFGLLEMARMLEVLQVVGCEMILSHKYIQDLVSGKAAKPDVIIASMRENDCNMGVVHKLDVPFIYFSASAAWPWSISNLRIPNDPTYCPQTVGHQTDRMDFMARLENTVQSAVMALARRYYWTPSVHDIMKKHLGEDVPSPLETEKKCSLVILNTHFSLDFPRPITPNIIEAGGMHVREARPLPQDLKKWVDDAGETGVVYFSLGSSFPGSSLPEKFRLIFVEAFSRIPQRVLWKWEADEMKDTSANVRFSKWVPQQDLLGHPNVRVFITQGGLLSTMETTFHGVAVLGIPIGSDQIINMKKTVSEGAGLMLMWDTLTADAVVDALTEIMTHPLYKEKVQKRAKVARDRDMHPLKKAVYWVEYVIRHKGAYHLQPASLHLNDIQYYMIDIYLFLHVVFAVVVCVSIVVCRCCYKTVCKTKQKQE